MGLLALSMLKQWWAVVGEEERPLSMCMKGEKRAEGRKLLQVDKNLNRLIWRCGVLQWRKRISHTHTPSTLSLSTHLACKLDWCSAGSATGQNSLESWRPFGSLPYRSPICRQ